MWPVSPTRLCALSLGLVAALVPARAAAQARAGATCELLGGKYTKQGNLSFFSGPVRLDCTDGLRVRADSAVHIQDLSETYLIGHVTYADSAKQLDADWAHYVKPQRYLQARGHVVVNDLETGSSVQGEQLQYYRPPEGAGAEDARVIVQGGRPHAELRPSREPGAPPDTTPPTLVDATRIELPGQNAFKATGDVKIHRGELQGSSQEASFDQNTRLLDLLGHAHIEQESYDLTARHIQGRLGPDDKIQRVEAEGQAQLKSDRASVDAPLIRIFFHDDAVQRLVALGERRLRAPAAGDTVGADSVAPAAAAAAQAAAQPTVQAPQPTARAPRPAAQPEETATPQPAAQMQGAAAPQAIARAEGIRLVADSIDALASPERVDSIYAVGQAYGEQLSDTVRADLPELVAADWARGDTIRAYFGARSDSAAASRDTAAAARDSTGAPRDSVNAVLERLVVVGHDEAPAQSVYRTREAGQPASARPSINYMVAQSITIRLHEGEVQAVEAQGPVHGIHLKPTESPPADTTGGAALGRPRARGTG